MGKLHKSCRFFASKKHVLRPPAPNKEAGDAAKRGIIIQKQEIMLLIILSPGCIMESEKKKVRSLVLKKSLKLFLLISCAALCLVLMATSAFAVPSATTRP